MEFVLGTEKTLDTIKDLLPKKPFSDDTIEFCQIVSKQLMGSSFCREYPDIMTLGFWLRKGSLLEYKKTYCTDSLFHIGRGVIFHIAPSNVPVNFAYSLFSGLLCGNCNIVRIPSKDFPQIRIIVDAIKAAIKEFEEYRDRICLVRYGHEQKDNDALSQICDVRVIWGGDNTIEKIRKSPCLLMFYPSGNVMLPVFCSSSYMLKRVSGLRFHNFVSSCSSSEYTLDS